MKINAPQVLAVPQERLRVENRAEPRFETREAERPGRNEREARGREGGGEAPDDGGKRGAIPPGQKENPARANHAAGRQRDGDGRPPAHRQREDHGQDDHRPQGHGRERAESPAAERHDASGDDQKSPFA